MIGSLVRWFGRRARNGRSGRGAGLARRFTPGLETLEDRAVPSASPALLGAEVGRPSNVSLLRTGTGSKPGGAGEGVSGAAPVGEVNVLNRPSTGGVEV
jgi:hypothetical protein